MATSEEDEDSGDREGETKEDDKERGDGQASPYSELFHLYNNKYDRILKERMMYKERKKEGIKLLSIFWRRF